MWHFGHVSNFFGSLAPRWPVPPTVDNANHRM